ncbi:MAG TPA: hypothetical protein VM577_08785 [Anaerovoracaceae bacterium]|nr:hypothetical protein [Anaerovoracaceae bacterium]
MILGPGLLTYASMTGIPIAAQFYLFPMIGLFGGGWLYFRLTGKKAEKQYQETKTKWGKFEDWARNPTIEGAQKLIEQYGINADFYTPPETISYTDPSGAKMFAKQPREFYSLVLIACLYGDIELLEYLLNEGADTSSIDQDSILQAVNLRTSSEKKSFLPILRLLILHGWKVEKGAYYNPNANEDINSRIDLFDYANTLTTAVEEKEHFEQLLAAPVEDVQAETEQPKQKRQKI